MPALLLTTNVKVSNVREFVLEFSKLAAEVLDKPEKRISVNYTYSEDLSFAGSFEPALLLQIETIGNINPESNVKHSAAFFKFFKEKLGVPGDRGYITFNDPGSANIGHAGKTLAAIMSQAHA